jgi:hypothetical protein
MMSDLVRKQIYLERSQVKAVQQKAAVLGLNESELIRQAIDRDLFGSGGFPTRPNPNAWEEIETFIASLSLNLQSGEPYQFDRDELYDRHIGVDDAASPD